MYVILCSGTSLTVAGGTFINSVTVIVPNLKPVNITCSTIPKDMTSGPILSFHLFNSETLSTSHVPLSGHSVLLDYSAGFHSNYSGVYNCSSPLSGYSSVLYIVSATGMQLEV